MHSREQTYAATAYKKVSEYPGPLHKDAQERTQYGSMAHKLPILIKSAGLTLALAFVDSRGKKPYEMLLEHLAATVGEGSRENLIARSRTADLTEYMHLTERVMFALKWYKRFAESVLEVKPTDEANGGTGHD